MKQVFIEHEVTLTDAYVAAMLAANKILYPMELEPYVPQTSTQGHD